MIVYGKNPVLEILKSGKKVSKIEITKANEHLIKQYSKLIGEIVLVDNNILNTKYNSKSQGIVATINEYKYHDVTKIVEESKDDSNVTLVILDSLEDPHNLGAILRSADATKVNGVIIPKNRSVHLNDTVAKVSTGAIEHVKVCEVTNLVNTINYLKENGYWIIGLELDGSIDYRKQDYHGKIAVVIGSEGKGIKRIVKENCDFLVKIPMYGNVNSLNASVSTALILYQILTNRGE